MTADTCCSSASAAIAASLLLFDLVYPSLCGVFLPIVCKEGPQRVTGPPRVTSPPTRNRFAIVT